MVEYPLNVCLQARESSQVMFSDECQGGRQHRKKGLSISRNARYPESVRPGDHAAPQKPKQAYVTDVPQD
jgi:hypothetical protein